MRMLPPVFLGAFTEIALRHSLTLVLVMLLGMAGVSAFVLLHLREQDSQQRFQQLVELQPDAVLVHRHGQFLYWNQAALELLGMVGQELQRRSVLDIIAPEFHQLVNTRISHVQRQKDPGISELEVVRPDGTRVPVESRGAQIEFDGEPSVLAILSDITERRENQQLREQLLQQVQRELHSSEERLRLALQSAPISVYQQDRDLRYIWVANLSDDATFEALVGKRDQDLLAPHEATRITALKQRVLSTGERVRDEMMLSIQGRERWFQISVEAQRDEQGLIIGITGAAFDISMYKEQERLLAYRNNYDPLTELPNRTLLVDRLRQILLNARRHNDALAVLTLDVNHFKRINNSLGYGGGDSLLQQLAGRLRECLRADDTVARVAGDRFVILLESVIQEHAIAAVSRKLLNRLELPFHIADAEVVISCSLGISIYPRDGETADALLSHAETALHQSRQSNIRQATYQFYDASTHALSDQQLQLENALRQAVAQQALQLHYQPQLDLRTQRIVAVEALVRWHDPVRGHCPPDVFIPLAEESELIHKLGDWVLREACQQQCRWEAQGLSLRVAVNLSARQLSDPDLLSRVKGILQHTGVSTHQIELEITESAVMENLQQALSNLHGLRELGFYLAVDDFGTGYSSLSYLHRLPVQCLKIDRSFVEEMGDGEDDDPIVRGVIAMAHALRLYVVAEGVETQAQLERLSAERCDLAQGYYLAKPLPAEAIAGVCEQFPGREDRAVIPIR